MNIKNMYYAANQWNSGADLVNKSNKMNRNRMSLSGRQGGKVMLKKTINSSKYMMRIAQARTSSQVSAIIRIARADMQFVKSCSSEKNDTAKAMRILKQVVSKSKVKMQKLKAEAELEKQEKLARSAEKEKLEKQIREKKNRKIKARTAAETADIINNEEVTLSKTTYLDQVGIGAITTSGSDGTLPVTTDGIAADIIAADTMTASAGIVSAGSSIEAMI